MSTLLLREQQQYAWRIRQLNAIEALLHNIGYDLGSRNITNSIVANLERLRKANTARFKEAQEQLKPANGVESNEAQPANGTQSTTCTIAWYA